MELKSGTNIHQIYKTLLTHEYMKKTTIHEKTGIALTSISAYLTRLRRLGLVEYSKSGRLIMWKKHPESEPLYPPQKDIRNDSRKGKTECPIVDSQTIISRANVLISELADELNLLRTQCNSYEDSGVVVDGVKLYRKVNK